MLYISSERGQPKCPIAGIYYLSIFFSLYFKCYSVLQLVFLLPGCPRILQAEKVVCDPLLVVEIEEMRCISRQTARANVVEDFTELDEEEDN